MKSNTSFNLRVLAQGAGPSAGTAVYAASTNTEGSIAPFDPVYWQYSLFRAYGGGTYVPGWGAAGAYVIAASGGHQAPPNVNAAIYDLNDWTWKLLTNANGVPIRTSDYEVGETNGDPCYEILGGSPATVPTPAHLYNYAVGVGGRYVRAAGMALTTSGQLSTLYAHAFDLSSRYWSRLSTIGAAPGDGNVGLYEGYACYDSVLNRIWFMPQQLHATNYLCYLDLADSTWKKSATFPYPADVSAYAGFIFDDVRREMYRWGATDTLYRLDMSSWAAGWKAVTTSGLLTASSLPRSRWHRYPDDHCHYTYDGQGENTLHKLDPATLEVSTVNISGASLPIAEQDLSAGALHESRFFFASGLGYFVWIPGGNRQVTLIRPP